TDAPLPPLEPPGIRVMSTNPDRVQHRAALEAEVEAAIACHDEDALLGLLEQADVPAVPVNTIDRVLADAQCAARDMVERVPHPTLGEVPIVGVPVKFSEMRPRVRTRAPRLGEHTDEVLAEHGYSPGRIAELRARKVVA
ncbi:MAG TPA: CoA transferase, partial [Candidatus Binatia bacterium]|nr:CoA transferase [Candidatus Binatia bacterium]